MAFVLIDADDNGHRIEVNAGETDGHPPLGKTKPDALLTRRKGADDCGDLVEATDHGVQKNTVCARR